jgi:hypothetical protein
VLVILEGNVFEVLAFQAWVHGGDVDPQREPAPGPVRA